MTRRIARALLVAFIVAGGVGWQRSRVTAQSAMPPCGIAMRVLVVSANGTEADLPAITTALDYVGTPFDVFITNSANPLTLETAVCATSSASETPARGLYQGIILTNNLSAGAYAGQLADYEKRFDIRQVTWFNTWPTALEDGLTSMSGAAQRVPGTLTAAGRAAFPYIRTGAPIDISEYAWTIFAKAETDPTKVETGATTVPLLTYPDSAGGAPYVLAAIHTYADGRQNLMMTFDSNASMLHSMLLSYGLVNWVTNGLFIGERHTYINAQIDDVFIDDQRWVPGTACGTSVDSANLPSYRMTAEDLSTVTAWQNLKRQNPLTSDLKITMAFNGLGTSPTFTYLLVGGSDKTVTGTPTTSGPNDLLIQAAVAQQANYFWSSHTYSHENLDNVSSAEATFEITENNKVAAQFGLDDYTLKFMVQPDVSGLTNLNFLNAAYANGIRYLVSNTSIPSQANPTPNTGYASSNAGVFVIPRRANNLFFNVATPEDWTAEYNCLYGPNGTLRRADGSPWFDQNLTYNQILDFISNELIAYLLRGELDPWMFHQPNLAKFTKADGSVHTLLGDLLDRTFEKYASYMTFPITSPSIETIGARMKDRTTIRNTPGIEATIKSEAIVLTSPVDVTIPVTGLKNGAELYANQWISWVPLAADTPVTLPLISPFVSETTSFSDGRGTRTANVTTTQPGDLLVAFVGAGGPNGQTATVSGAGLSWTLVRRANAQAGTAEIWSAIAPGRLTNAVVTSTLSAAANDQTLTVIPFAGAGGVGASANASGGNGAPSVSLTTTKSHSLVYGVGTDPKHATTRTVGPNQWMVHQFVDAAAGDTFWIQALSSPVQVVGTLVRLNDTAPTKDPWNFAAVEIFPAPKPTTVPSVVNITKTAATSAIIASGINLGAVRYESSTTVAPGFVISQNPAGGTAALTGTFVDLVVSAPRVDRTVSANAGGTASVNVTTTSGQLLIAFVSVDGPSGSAQTATVSGGGLTWTRVARANAQRGSAEIWKAKATANATFRVQSAEGRNNYAQTLTVVALSGAGDVGASRAVSGTTGAAALSLTTTKPYSIVYGVGFDSASAVRRTLGAGQGMIYEFPNTQYNQDLWVQGRLDFVSIPATVLVNTTAPTSTRWNLSAIEITVP
jgi:PASTA domain